MTIEEIKAYNKGVNDMIHELSKMSIRVSTESVPHKYMKAVGTHHIEEAGQRLKKRLSSKKLKKVEKSDDI